MDDTLPSNAGVACYRGGPFTAPLGVSNPLALKDIWSGLVNGRLRVTNGCVAMDRCFVYLKHVRDGRVPTKSAEVVERVFSGEQPKVVAAELAISLSSICHYCKEFLHVRSDRPRAAGVSAFFVIAACAARGAAVTPARLHGLDHEGNLVLSVETPIALLESAALSQAERDIAFSLIEGRTRAEIGAQRGTSPRTLANQISSIYRKFRVSGRRELMAAVLAGHVPAASQLPCR